MRERLAALESPATVTPCHDNGRATLQRPVGLSEVQLMVVQEEESDREDQIRDKPVAMAFSKCLVLLRCVFVCSVAFAAVIVHNLVSFSCKAIAILVC